MPAGLISRSPWILQDAQIHGSSWEPLSGTLGRGSISSRQAAAAYFGTDGDVTTTLANGWQGRTSRVSSSFKGKAEEEEENDGMNGLEFTMRDGKKVYLCNQDVDCCQQSCKKAMPHTEDISGASAGSAQMAALGESGKAEKDDCDKFCDANLKAQCFPGDSTVVVWHRGPVALEDVKVGDIVLSVRPTSSGLGWQLCFEEVLAFLHHEPHAEAEFLRLRHEMGQVHLTASHLVFAQSKSSGGASYPAPIFAREVSVGDKLLAPWIDGCLTTPKVLEVQSVRKRGLYAPLLGTGALLVDGTAASCYAIPENLSESKIYQRLSEVASASSLHATYHALFLPLRLVCRTAAGLPELTASMRGTKDVVTLGRPTKSAPIHPYASVLYNMASSLVA